MSQEYLYEKFQRSLEKLIENKELNCNFIEVLFVDECFDNDFDYCAHVICDEELYHILVNKKFSNFKITVEE